MEEEGLTIEYKKSLNQLKEGVISLSSMLNKCRYGLLYFGIDPDKNPLGSISPKRPLRMSRMRFESI